MYLYTNETQLKKAYADLNFYLGTAESLAKVWNRQTILPRMTNEILNQWIGSGAHYIQAMANDLLAAQHEKIGIDSQASGMKAKLLDVDFEVIDRWLQAFIPYQHASPHVTTDMLTFDKAGTPSIAPNADERIKRACSVRKTKQNSELFEAIKALSEAANNATTTFLKGFAEKGITITRSINLVPELITYDPVKNEYYPNPNALNLG